MGTKGQLQLTGALVTGIEVKSVDAHLDYIAIALESSEFVGLLGSNRIRLIFVGCRQSGFDLCMWSGQATLYSFYIKDSPPDLGGHVRYCVEMSSSSSIIEIVAKGVQVELSKSTHQHH